MREMKDSGQTWLGAIPAKWDQSTIGSLYTLRNEKVSDRDYPPLSVTMKGVVPQLDTAAKTDSHDDRKLVKKGDFAINSRSDRRGSCGISNYDGSVSLINTILTPREEMNPDYYNWVFHTAQFADEFYRWGHGIVDDLWTTRWQEMKNIVVAVPSLDEQELIAETISSEVTKVDALIANQEAQIEKLKQYKQSLITEVVTKGLDPDAPMKDSGNPWFPTINSKYKLTRVGLHFDIILGKMLCPIQLDTTYTLEPYYCAADVHFDGLSDSKKTMWFSPLEKETYLVKDGDLLVVEGGAGAGGCAIVIKQDNPTYIQNSVMIVRPKRSSDIRFLRYLIELLVKSGYIDFVCNKATIPHFTKDKLSSVPLILPDLYDQVVLADYLDDKTSKIDAIISTKRVKIETLTNYKRSLIYEYVTGKKEVEG